MTAIEFRDRSRRAPGGDLRIVLGTPKNRAERKALEALREMCKRLAARGEWDVLRALKARAVTPDEVARLIDAYGWADFRTHLDLQPMSGIPTLDEHAEHWLGTLGGREQGTKKIYARDIGRLRDFEVDGKRLGERPWYAVHPHNVRDLVDALRGQIARNTLRTAMGAWGSFYTWAVDRERSEARAAAREPLLAVSPVREAKVWGRSETTRHRFLSPEEFERLLEVATRPMRAQYATLALCGFRIEEFMVMPTAHVLLPTHFHVGPWGHWAPKGYPRVQRGVRDVPIHRSRLLPLLEEYAEEWAGESTFFVNPRTGEGWSYSPFTERLRMDVEDAGMIYGQRKAGERQPEGVTPHTLRHTLASWLAQQDVQLMKIARILGDTEETVRRHYAHLLPGDLDRTVNRLFSEALTT